MKTDELFTATDNEIGNRATAAEWFDEEDKIDISAMIESATPKKIVSEDIQIDKITSTQGVIDENQKSSSLIPSIMSKIADSSDGETVLSTDFALMSKPWGVQPAAEQEKTSNEEEAKEEGNLTVPESLATSTQIEPSLHKQINPTVDDEIAVKLFGKYHQKYYLKPSELRQEIASLMDLPEHEVIQSGDLPEDRQVEAAKFSLDELLRMKDLPLRTVTPLAADAGDQEINELGPDGIFALNVLSVLHEMRSLLSRSLSEQLENEAISPSLIDDVDTAMQDVANLAPMAETIMTSQQFEEMNTIAEHVFILQQRVNHIENLRKRAAALKFNDKGQIPSTYLRRSEEDVDALDKSLVFPNRPSLDVQVRQHSHKKESDSNLNKSITTRHEEQIPMVSEMKNIVEHQTERRLRGGEKEARF
eukprot:GDKJ01004766.1.p1 GENE.GDKJ01004766.1~~GDKJ01004766.1.p1  ORF type:complete len:472 (-),score=126.79 GDKJ01004766.1:142-1398(-)